MLPALCWQRLGTIFVQSWIACCRLLDLLVARLGAKRLRIFLRFDLDEPPRAFLENQVLLLCKVGIGIGSRHEVAVTLQQARRHGSKNDVLFQAFRDSLVCQIRIVYDLPVISSLLCDPAL